MMILQKNADHPIGKLKEKIHKITKAETCKYQYFEKGIRNFQSVDKNKLVTDYHSDCGK